MSIQDDLAAALGAIAGATLALNTIGAQATGAINQVTNSYNARLASLAGSFYVNQVTGNDGNTGLTPAQPLRTLQAALAKVPAGGVCSCVMQSDYTIQTDVSIVDKHLRLSSDSVTRWRITPGRSINAGVQPNLRVLSAFKLRGAASFAAGGLTLVMPSIEGFGGYNTTSTADYFGTELYQLTSPQSVVLAGCSIDLPNNPFGFMLMDNWCVAVQITSLTLVGEATSLNGKFLRGQSNIAGVATSNYPQLLTNLLTI